MGQVVSLDAFRRKRADETDELYIDTEEAFCHYVNEAREYRRVIDDQGGNKSRANDPFWGRSVMRYKQLLEVIEKAIADYASRSFKPSLLKSIEEGDLLTALPTSLPEETLLRTRLTLKQEHSRLDYFVKQLRDEINTAIPFRSDLIAIHDKNYASLLKIRRVLMVNGWWEEDKP